MALKFNFFWKLKDVINWICGQKLEFFWKIWFFVIFQLLICVIFWSKFRFLEFWLENRYFSTFNLRHLLVKIQIFGLKIATFFLVFLVQFIQFWRQNSNLLKTWEFDKIEFSVKNWNFGLKIVIFQLLILCHFWSKFRFLAWKLQHFFISSPILALKFNFVENLKTQQNWIFERKFEF